MRSTIDSIDFQNFSVGNHITHSITDINQHALYLFRRNEDHQLNVEQRRNQHHFTLVKIIYPQRTLQKLSEDSIADNKIILPVEPYTDIGIPGIFNIAKAIIITSAGIDTTGTAELSG